MKCSEFEELVSPSRLARYNSPCKDHILKTLALYQANIRMSQAFLAVLSVFEIVLRNKIDVHYRSRFPAVAGRPEWLLASILPGGFFTGEGCESSLAKIKQGYEWIAADYWMDIPT